ncbi:MAG: type II toxin-antitoxin system Phd/YefM family antitoxin [Lachnospiraceae bacterium]|nr:type II toxin-antitoxin system Phd/YefM family antitoxin [Lachnospiraceae bacterium]
MVVTANEFETNIGKYFEMLVNEDIFVTQNGKTVAKIVNPGISAVDSISGLLRGKLPNDYDSKNLREERIAGYEMDD